MAEIPDDPISQMESEMRKNRVQDDIERDDLRLLYIVSHLPANASLLVQDAYALLDDPLLLGKILF